MSLPGGTARPAPVAAPRILGSPAAQSPTTFAGELHGVQDGPALRLPSGVTLRMHRLGDARVSKGELMDTLRGINQLPGQDLQLMASKGVEVHLLPTARLENDLLGATRITAAPGSTVWQPQLVRVAVRAGRDGMESTPEIVQHEIGHVISVLRTQNRLEEPAELYAREH